MLSPAELIHRGRNHCHRRTRWLKTAARQSEYRCLGHSADHSGRGWFSGTYNPLYIEPPAGSLLVSNENGSDLEI